MSEARRLLVSGRVQGVGFRAFVAGDAAADRRSPSGRKSNDGRGEGERRGPGSALPEAGRSGGVRNLSDGRVEVFAEGEAEALAGLEAACARGPFLARVGRVVVERAMPEGRPGFRQVADA